MQQFLERWRKDIQISSIILLHEPGRAGASRQGYSSILQEKNTFSRCQANTPNPPLHTREEIPNKMWYFSPCHCTSISSAWKPTLNHQALKID